MTPPPVDQATRITRICTLLSQYKPVDEARKFLYTQHAHLKRFCTICTPRRTPGSCGPTCSLLSPHSYDKSSPCVKWLAKVKSEHRLYQELVRDMQKHGRGATMQRVAGWESAVEDLTQWAQNLSEKNAAEAEEVVRSVRARGGHVTLETGWMDIRATEGLDLNWSFDRAWGKPVGSDAEFDWRDVEEVSPTQQTGPGPRWALVQSAIQQEGQVDMAKYVPWDIKRKRIETASVMPALGSQPLSAMPKRVRLR